MDLLEKFGQIEVKADNRISEYDRRFCQAHQTAYEKAREFIKKMATTRIVRHFWEADIITSSTQKYSGIGSIKPTIASSPAW